MQHEIYPLLSFAATVEYGTVRKCIMGLEQQGMLERVQKGIHRELVPTERGYDWFRPAR